MQPFTAVMVIAVELLRSFTAPPNLAQACYLREVSYEHDAAHQGLPAGVRKTDLLALIENLGKHGLGVSSAAARLLRHYVWRSRDADYQPGRICAVWDRVSHSAEQLDLSTRSINEAERELESHGLIRRTTGNNGARVGQRAGEVIRWAAGVNLAPLIARYSALKVAWEARCLHQQAGA